MPEQPCRAKPPKHQSRPVLELKSLRRAKKSSPNIELIYIVRKGQPHLHIA